MEIIKRQHTYFEDGIYKMQQIPGDIDTIYEMEQEAFDGAELPDGDYYSAEANAFLRSKITFAEWDDPQDCRFIGFRVVDGVKCDFEQIDIDEFKARSANRVVIK